MPGFLGRLATAFRAARMTFQGYGGQGYGWRLLLPGSQYDYEAAAGDLWRNSSVAACLRWLRTNAPEPRLEVVREKADGTVTPVPGHDLVRLVQRPNAFYDWYTLSAAVVLSAVVDGNAYLRKVRSASGKVAELWWVPHWLINPRWNPDGSEFIGWYEYQVNGALERIPVEDVVHWRVGIDPRDDRRGFSELKQAVRAVCGLNECDTYTASILRNMGIPGVVIGPGSPDVSLQTEDADDIREEWRRRYTSEQRGDPFIASRVIKVEKIALTPEELRLDKLPARLEDQVCAAIGVPPMVVGLSSGAQHKTYANYGEARRAAYEDCLIPLQKALAECLTWQLLKADFAGGGRVRFDYSGVQCLAENETEVAERVGKLYQTYQVITRAEAREAVGYDTTPEDEVYFAEAGGGGAGEPDGDEGDDQTGDDLTGDDQADPGTRGREQRRPFGRRDQADRGDLFPAGDGREDHGDNTYGLPDGIPLRRAYRRFLRRVAEEVLGTLPEIGAPLNPAWPNLDDFIDPMTAAITPVLSAYWDRAGRTTRDRLGLDPAAWRVVDPNTHAAIVAQAHDFCASTLATTTLDARSAYEALKAELAAGVVTEGEAVPELARRVRKVFTDASKAKAGQIARTETSRAVHRASEQSAAESGVVAGKVWLLSANACPFCHELAERSKETPVPLGEDFGARGNNPAYSAIPMPPGHPSCRCSVTYRLTPEYQALVDANPPGTFAPGPLGPGPK